MKRGNDDVRLYPQRHDVITRFLRLACRDRRAFVERRPILDQPSPKIPRDRSAGCARPLPLRCGDRGLVGQNLMPHSIRRRCRASAKNSRPRSVRCVGSETAFPPGDRRESSASWWRCAGDTGPPPSTANSHQWPRAGTGPAGSCRHPSEPGRPPPAGSSVSCPHAPIVGA
jgi:hypothetical protein